MPAANGPQAHFGDVDFMVLHCIQRMLLIAVIASLSERDTGAFENADRKSKAPQGRVERLLEAVARGEDLDDDASEQIPLLIEIVENGEAGASDLAIRALARMKSKSNPAIATICK